MTQIPIGEELEAFIEAHLNDDLSKLALQAKKFPKLPFAFALDQIHARKVVGKKLPSWAQIKGLAYPSRLSMEQCSSEATALWKANWIAQHIGNGHCFADLSGGLGADTWAFAQHASGIYVEQQAALCDIAAHNFGRLHNKGIQVICGEAEAVLPTLPACGFIYLDPARRDGEKKLVSLTQCAPDVVSLQNELLQKAPFVLVKVSPLLEIYNTLLQLPTLQKIAVVAVEGECKEVLLLLGREKLDVHPILAVNIRKQGEERFEGSLEEERALPAAVADPMRYIYEPHAAIMKAGLFKTLSAQMQMPKLHPHTHLYTSAQPVPHFPGRGFEVEEILPFQSKLFKKKGLLPSKANVAVRNFPLTAEELQQKAGIQNGGECYIFGTTVRNGESVLLICKKA
jgi:hypothetical protein